MFLTDTHTHIYLAEFDEDREAMIERAINSGVSKMFMPNIDSQTIPGLFKLADKYPEHCFPMIGLHPCSVTPRYSDELKVVEHWLSKRKFFAIGEIGVDLYWDKSFLEQQLDAFRHMVKLAKKSGLPIVIHTRNSFEEAFAVVADEQDGKLKGIFHCFSGSVEQANKVVELGGFKMGIGGVLTFKNSGLDKIVKEIAMEHFVLETDAPYLAPVPYRGKRNEPAYIMEIATHMAKLLGKTVEEIASTTSANATAVFGI